MVTATQISTYLYCPRKLFISEVLKCKEPPKESLVKGLVWHQTYETINKRDEDIVKSIRTKSYNDIFDLYRREYAKFLRNSIIRNKSELKKFNIDMIALFKDYWPRIEDDGKNKALKLSQFISENNIFGDELWARLTPKILSEQRFSSDKLGLSGIIDVIEVHNVITKQSSDKGLPEMVYVPIELKTGSVPKEGMWDGHKVQLATYMILLEDAGMNVSEGVVRYKDSDDSGRILQMNSMLKDEVLDFARNVRLILDSKDLPDRVSNTKKCTKCSFRELCYDDTKMDSMLKSVFTSKTS